MTSVDDPFVIREGLTIDYDPIVNLETVCPSLVEEYEKVKQNMILLRSLR